MKNQKFKRGNLVKISSSYSNIIYSSKPIEPHENAGKEGIIIGSYADKFGGSNTTSYTIMFENGGESSWYDEEYLTLIKEGGEYLIEEAKNKFKLQQELDQDISYIIENYPQISSISLLYIFDKIGFKSSFLSNGEYFCLFNEAAQIKPLLDCLFDKDSKLSSIQKVLKLYKSDFVEPRQELIIDFFKQIEEKKNERDKR